MKNQTIGGVQQGITSKANRVKSDIAPPRGSVPTGEVTAQGQIVYRRTVNRKVGREQIRDADGKIQYWTGPSGEKRAPKYRAVMEKVDEEFILHDRGDGIVDIQPVPRPSKEELLATAKAKRLAEQQDKVNDMLLALAEKDMDLTDLTTAIRGMGEKQEPAPPAVKKG